MKIILAWVLLLCLVASASIYKSKDIMVSAQMFRYIKDDLFLDRDFNTLIIGSSTIKRLHPDAIPDCGNIISRGFDNGVVEHLSTYISLTSLPNVQDIIIYIGENDIAKGKQATTSFKQLSKVIDAIERTSNAKIAVMNIKYSPARSQYHDDFMQLNTLIDQAYKASNISVIEFDQLATQDLFLNDGIHLSQRGYHALAKPLNQFCSQR